MMFIGVECLVFILFGGCSLSWICRFVSLANFRKLSAIIFSSTFSALCSLSYLSKTPLTQMSHPLFYSCRSLRLCHFFFQSMFSPLFRFGNFYFSVSSLILCFVPSILLFILLEVCIFSKNWLLGLLIIPIISFFPLYFFNSSHTYYHLLSMFFRSILLLFSTR